MILVTALPMNSLVIKVISHKFNDIGDSVADELFGH
jgi:hypothetical protein